MTLNLNIKSIGLGTDPWVSASSVGLNINIEEELTPVYYCPTISEKGLSITPAGNVRYQLKTPYWDGTTHVVFEPMDLLAGLAALVPKPRVNLTRFHGVFAGTLDRANSRFRSELTPGRSGKPSDRLGKSPAERSWAMISACVTRFS